MEYIALEINGEEVSLDEVLKLAKFNGAIQFVEEAVDRELIRQAARERGLAVSDDELQRAADDFRIARDLQSAEATEAWLAARRLSLEDWESLLEDEMTRSKLRAALTSDRVERYFAENRLSFDAVTVSRILLDSEDLARELRAQILEEGASFHALAREHSMDAATRRAGGYLGVVRRLEMEPAVESAVYGARVDGGLVGPIKTDEGWLLARVEDYHRPTLDEATRAQIESILFEEWLSERRRKSRIKMPLLELAEDATAEDE